MKNSNLETWEDLERSSSDIVEMSTEELEEAQGAAWPLFLAGAALGFAIGSRVYPHLR